MVKLKYKVITNMPIVRKLAVAANIMTLIHFDLRKLSKSLT